MTFAYDVYAEQADGTRTEIANPGDDYDDQEGTYECLVEDLDPPPGPVEVGTVIRLTIVCGPEDDDGEDGSDGSSSDDGSESSSPDDGSESSSPADGSNGSSSDSGTSP